MIDLHCHIIPGVDDGARTIEDALDMAHAAVTQGITHILCTPHHNNGAFINPKNEVISKVTALQKEFDDREIPLTLFEGQEVRITGDLLGEITADNILFADLSNKYLLIEFPSMDVPAYTEQVFFELISRQVTPIIVHPERNSVFMEDPNKLIPFLEMGVLAQLTAPSYVGVFGKKIKKTATIMLEHNLVQMMASDAHNIEKRGFFMKEAYAAMTKEFGAEKVADFQKVNKDIINGECVDIRKFTEVKKKFGFLR